jgi:hypothetical protein
MSIRIQLDELPATLDALPPTAFALLAVDGSVRCVAVTVVSTSPLVVQRDGSTLANADASITLLWPVARPNFALLVDGVPQRYDGGALTIEPTSAMLHRLPNEAGDRCA